ncbi:Oidioi.mRNA.OKI2018_I69.chr2.g7469.t1.cds [Oikopleura dioica]|uniref:Oidioi.mRNA.OKI2018_I69.chr2.g7469.t1.cds n=1 Tax=Oikopleura dioica TaxID=34765 RepID=A0ABN7T6S3_OIKDI|nr:Oidioi.mRNA.OKI2018_I69.chr2.g7469.t1.cds [Oikopleura dioica]
MARIAMIFNNVHSPKIHKARKDQKKLNEWVWQRQDSAYYIFMPVAETDRFMQCCHITKTEHKGKNITIFGRNLLHDMKNCTTTYANWRKDIRIPEDSEVSVTTFVDKLSVAVSISKITLQ